MTNNGYAFRYSTSRAKMDAIVQLLSVPLTMHQIADLVAMDFRTVKCYVTGLIAEKRIYVCSWRRNSPGSPSRVFLAGNKRHATKPKTLSNAERMRRRRQDAEFSMDQMMRQRAKRIAPRRDKSITALFGESS